MESEAAELEVPRLYPVNRVQPLDGVPVIFSLVEITAEYTIVRTRSPAHKSLLASNVEIRLEDDAGSTYRWTQAIGGGGSMADVRCDVFAGSPPFSAKLLYVIISRENHPGSAKTAIDLSTPFV